MRPTALLVLALLLPSAPLALQAAPPDAGPAPAEAAAPEAPPAAEGALADPISAALAAVDPEVVRYNDHLVTLASPFLGGRLPGTPGMEVAKDYVEHWLREAGLEPPFRGEGGQEGTSYRQPFELAGTGKLASQSLAVRGADVPLAAGEDYTALSIGAGGEASGPAVFVGYSVAGGPDGYESYPEDADLTGKIAVMLRFEPMDAEGTSRWSDGGRWSPKATFAEKLEAAAERGAAGVVIVNPPGSSDPRAERLAGFNLGGSPELDAPVFHLTREAGERLLSAAHPEGRGLEELRRAADEAGGIVALDVELDLAAEIVRETTIAENVGGLLPGRGALADELVVIGAHLDHLGMGEFGSRSGAGELHPGADDNASGSAALLLLADRLAADYAALPEDADARAILIVGFSAEESGLNGSFHYVREPIRPLEDHALMINFDMIGRIREGRLSVSGAGTGEGLAELLAPIYARSPLTVVEREGSGGGSDHLPFLRREVPALFAIIADFHDDYHTPRDTSDKINRVAAVRTVELFHEIAREAALHPEGFPFVAPPPRRPRGAAADAAAELAELPEIRVRLGVLPATPEGEGLGVRIGEVTPDTPAEAAGLQAGDVLLRWDGAKVEGLVPWMQTLAEHEPGDEVSVGVLRDGEELTLRVTLAAR